MPVKGCFTVADGNIIIDMRVMKWDIYVSASMSDTSARMNHTTKVSYITSSAIKNTTRKYIIML